MTVAVHFDNVTRRFGEVRALDRVSFEIENGEFFAMLGPSGSGKTTSLRMIAGFDRPTEGDVAIEGRSMRGVPPWERNVNTVFQDYALFPHMSVRDNVAYGLMVKGVERRAREDRAEAMLGVVALTGFGDRRPAQLSGGQRQRVALARALVNEPDVLLLDEPLGALDLKLRQQMQVELKALQRRVGITFVYVTHDQGEALAMSDRIAVFNHGRIEQIGTPEDVYERPETAFVADFVGASNLIDAPAALRLTGRSVRFAIRPERVRIGAGEAGSIAASGTIAAVHYLGAASRLDVELDVGGQIMALRPAGSPGAAPQAGQRIDLSWPAEAMRELHEMPVP